MISPEFLSSGSSYHGPNKRFSRRVNLQSYIVFNLGREIRIRRRALVFTKGFFLLRRWLERLDQSINQALEFQIIMRLYIHCLNWKRHPLMRILMSRLMSLCMGLKAPQDQTAQSPCIYLTPNTVTAFNVELIGDLTFKLNPGQSVSISTRTLLSRDHNKLPSLLDEYENTLRNKLDKYAPMKRRMITLRPSYPDTWMKFVKRRRNADDLSGKCMLTNAACQQDAQTCKILLLFLYHLSQYIQSEDTFQHGWQTITLEIWETLPYSCGAG